MSNARLRYAHLTLNEDYVKYSDLKVWQKSMNLVDMIYQVTDSLPASEKYGLCSQLQRAAVSIPANIAEGHGRKFTNVFLNHLSIASGSLMEVETLLLIAQRRKYISDSIVTDLLTQAEEIGKMLSGLSKSLKATPV